MSRVMKECVYPTATLPLPKTVEHIFTFIQHSFTSSHVFTNLLSCHRPECSRQVVSCWCPSSISKCTTCSRRLYVAPHGSGDSFDFFPQEKLLLKGPLILISDVTKPRNIIEAFLRNTCVINFFKTSLAIN